jgi:hypothetical protein
MECKFRGPFELGGAKQQTRAILPVRRAGSFPSDRLIDVLWEERFGRKRLTERLPEPSLERRLLRGLHASQAPAVPESSRAPRRSTMQLREQCACALGCGQIALELVEARGFLDCHCGCVGFAA